MRDDLESLKHMAEKYNVFLLDDDEEEELGKKNEELDMLMILERNAH